MKKYIDIIKGSPLFVGINSDDIISMMTCLSAKEKHYQKGEYIFRIGDNITELALLISGNVHIQKEDFWGNQSILTEISPGDIFGETYACARNEPISINAISTQDSTVIFLDVNKILTTCSSACTFHSRLIQNLLGVFALKNKMLTAKLEHMAQRTTRTKLLSYLSEQSTKNSCAEFNIPFNRQQLADYLAVDRSALSNELGKLRDEGLLDFHKNHFILK